MANNDGEEVDDSEEPQEPVNKKSQRQISRHAARAFSRARKNTERHEKQVKEGIVTSAQISETDYYFSGGLRRVKPYYHVFTVNAKERWFGRTVLDVFTTEFIGHNQETQIERGNIRINDNQISKDTTIQQGDRLNHRVHRHEPPVSSTQIEVIATTDELVAVNKPASIPIHPSGRYRHNSLLFILAKEFKLQNVHTIYRLDRLTSGIVVMAKSTALAAKYQKEVRERNMEKVYLARVKGEFSEKPITVDQPILIQQFRVGINMVHPNGKPAKTFFERLKYFPASNTSLLKCVPFTGRTHQIRVHLQWLGFPIANDPIYSGAPGVLPPNAGHALDEEGDSEMAYAAAEPSSSTQPSNSGQPQDDINHPEWSDPICPQCAHPPPDPHLDECIWLHALSYTCPGLWSYNTKPPSWAEE